MKQKHELFRVYLTQYVNVALAMREKQGFSADISPAVIHNAIAAFEHEHKSKVAIHAAAKIQNAGVTISGDKSKKAVYAETATT